MTLQEVRDFYAEHGYIKPEHYAHIVGDQSTPVTMRCVDELSEKEYFDFWWNRK